MQCLQCTGNSIRPLLTLLLQLSEAQIGDGGSTFKVVHSRVCQVSLADKGLCPNLVGLSWGYLRGLPIWPCKRERPKMSRQKLQCLLSPALKVIHCHSLSVLLVTQGAIQGCLCQEVFISVRNKL